jgi:hypothetical protein
MGVAFEGIGASGGDIFPAIAFYNQGQQVGGIS